MLFWAPSGRAWMATDEQRACTHCEGSVRTCTLPARETAWPLKGELLDRFLSLHHHASNPVLGCRSIEIGSWLRGLGLG